MTSPEQIVHATMLTFTGGDNEAAAFYAAPVSSERDRVMNRWLASPDTSTADALRFFGMATRSPNLVPPVNLRSDTLPSFISRCDAGDLWLFVRIHKGTWYKNSNVVSAIFRNKNTYKTVTDDDFDMDSRRRPASSFSIPKLFLYATFVRTGNYNYETYSSDILHTKEGQEALLQHLSSPKKLVTPDGWDTKVEKQLHVQLLRDVLDFYGMEGTITMDEDTLTKMVSVIAGVEA